MNSKFSLLVDSAISNGCSQIDAVLPVRNTVLIDTLSRSDSPDCIGVVWCDVVWCDVVWCGGTV